jgi:predicted dehydrogenase
MSRRRLLGCLATAGLPLFLPARLLGNEAPSKRVHLLMLGAGRQAVFVNMPTLLGMPEVRVVAVCDVDRKRAQAAKAKVDQTYGDRECKLFTDWREALEMDDLDAVMNSTPDHWHAITSLAAIRKGLHVSCEKPITRYHDEGRLLADAAVRKGVVFRTDSECRSHGYMIKTAGLALNGYLGTIRRFEVGVPREMGEGFGNPAPAPVPEHLDYEMWLGPAPHVPYCADRVHPDARHDGRPGWMRILDYGEGIVTNWGTHLLDVASLINGSERGGPVAVEGTGAYPPEGSLWNTLIDFKLHYRYANGVTLDYKMDVPYLRVEGDEGWIQAHWHSEGGLKASDPKLLRMKLKESDRRVPTRSDKQDFISAIREGTTSMADAEVGHRSCTIGRIGHIAISRGKPLDWDPVAERFANDPDANALLLGRYRAPWKLEA